MEIIDCTKKEQIMTLNKIKLCSGPASLVHILNVWTIIMQSLNVKEWNLFEIQISHKVHNVSSP